METNMMVLPGESILMTTQMSFGNNGDKWRADVRIWHYDNTLMIIRKLKIRTMQDVALLGLELWWARIHIKKEWGKFLDDIDMDASAVSRFKTFVVRQGLLTIIGKSKPTAEEILYAIRIVNSDVAMLQQMNMRKFWGVKSDEMVVTGPPEERHLEGFSPAMVIKKLRRDFAKSSTEEQLGIIDTLFVIQYLFSGFIKEIYNSGDPVLVKEINEQYRMRSDVFMPEVEPE